MAWTKKASAPATFSLKNAMAAMVAGTEASWLTDWMFWIPDNWFDTSAFCAAGPPPTPAGLSLVDLLAAAVAGKSPLNWGLLAASIIPRLQEIADDRVFSAYCENVVPATTGCGPNFVPFAPQAGWVIADVPAGTTSVFVGGGHGGNVQQAFYVTNHDLGTINWSAGLTWSTVAPDIYIDNPGRAAATQIAIRINQFVPTGYKLCGTAAHTDTQTPTLEPQPAGAPPAITYKVYGTIADLGAELDRQETKLDTVLSGLRYLAGYSAAPTSDVGPATPILPNVKTPVGKAYAAVVTITAIPAAVSNITETPTFWRNLGHVTSHTADGPLAAEPIVHSPQVFIFDPRVTDISVSPMQPATATVKLLYPSK